MTEYSEIDKDYGSNRQNRCMTDNSSPKACNTVAIAQLNRAYLHAVIQAYEDHDTALISALGLPLDLAQRLSEAPVSVIESLGRFRTPIANFIGDAIVIDRLLAHKTNRTAMLKKCDELLQHGGSFDFIARLTGLLYNDVALRANALGLAQPGSRPRALSDDEWLKAEAAWNATTDLTLLERWLRVANETGISIRRLHAAYRKYDYLIDLHEA